MGREREEGVKTCCEHHNVDCNQGRTCPERTRRAQASALRLTESDVGVEAALPIVYVGPEPSEPWWRLPALGARKPLPSEPFDWQALVLWIGVAVAFGAIAALSIADPRDLSTIWPRLVALASF